MHIPFNNNSINSIPWYWTQQHIQNNLDLLMHNIFEKQIFGFAVIGNAWYLYCVIAIAYNQITRLTHSSDFMHRKI